ncbi:hypothetical protein RVS70_09390 [Virgibacillus sp. M23]|uniref:hypothetical protein n=1 Tax=Virgibacillus sp. M23 TaxID=3079030 RepID=UPI002A919FB9|nr:hypothetical protein [Virgibacillus sp. M23]MDY7044417.1 hypothetical protein [Virgibacillus sp. M23]
MSDTWPILKELPYKKLLITGSGGPDNNLSVFGNMSFELMLSTKQVVHVELEKDDTNAEICLIVYDENSDKIIEKGNYVTRDMKGFDIENPTDEYKFYYFTFWSKPGFSGGTQWKQDNLIVKQNKIYTLLCSENSYWQEEDYNDLKVRIY